jgi:hypothetical protein
MHMRGELLNTLVHARIYVGSVVYGPLRALAETTFVHLGLCIDPCVIFITTHFYDSFTDHRLSKKELHLVQYQKPDSCEFVLPLFAYFGSQYSPH